MKTRTVMTLSLLLMISLGLSFATAPPAEAGPAPVVLVDTSPGGGALTAADFFTDRGPTFDGSEDTALTAADFPVNGAPGEETEPAAPADGNCTNVVTADVVALDQPFYYNRLGAINANGMMYALRRDVVAKDPALGLVPGNVALREDKRPRPIVLRMNEGDCLEITFTNLLDPNPFVFNLNPEAADLVNSTFDFPLGSIPGLAEGTQVNVLNDQPVTRAASIHVDGLSLVGDISSDGSFVGQNASSLVAPGNSAIYTYYGAHEATHLMYSMGATVGGEGVGGSRSFGLFGAVHVEPAGSTWYRSQLTRVEMDLATPAEAFTDWNGNGVWDQNIAEPLTDWNGNGVQDNGIAEPLIDWNGNGVQDNGIAEPFTDSNGNGVFDAGETFTDWNGNGVWDASVNEPFTDWNGSGVWDASVNEPFTDWNGNGVWDASVTEPLADTNGDGVFNAHRTTPGGQPILDYDAVYPAGTGAGKDGLPIIKILNGNAIVHTDINAIIDDRGFPYSANEAYPTRGTEPFREFTIIFHDEVFAVQAFPSFYNDAVLEHTLHSVRDSFPINYGSGGIGSEIIANRLQVGPMWDCVDCKYEEFFLTAWTVGDPAMVVDIPANADLNMDGIPDAGAKATTALYPDDPSNVHHSYLGDRVKFRNLHAGPKEHHIFHLHAHQWLLNPDDPQSNYLDGQAIGPGAGYSYEIAYGGSGNRNLTPGDSIFHCHFYPHFAMGMWELWRVHDVFEQGTVLDPVPGNSAAGRPAPGARALADGEIPAGTPIPGLVPMPGIAMAPMPDAAATVVQYDLNGDFMPDSSQWDLDDNGIADLEEGFPAAATGTAGYPFYIPGVMSHRPPTPALDMDPTAGGWDGGLPRHVVTSGPDDFPNAAEIHVSRLDLNKVVHEAAALQIDENGTPAEQQAMLYHAGPVAGGGDPTYNSFLPDGTPANDAAGFEVNGLPPAPGAPYAEPCRTDPVGDAVAQIPQNRTVKAANIEMDIVLNKVGWHFQQQRFEALWEDVVPTLTNAKAPEPLVMRLNSTDCAQFEHSNLVPNVYQLDDYQVRTPTDVIGQHIHLVKFDVTSADGAANGFNYEDGTLSPDEVRERIEAFNHGDGLEELNGNINMALVPADHPFFGPTGPQGQDWRGARTTIQRWYADPLLERSWDGGVGTVFTHDHYGPSTHQQIGLYSTLLVEPEGSTWRHNETGVQLGTRPDGGPTTWQAIIEVPPALWTDLDGDGDADDPSHREFYFEFADFQHAYEAGGGALGTIDNEDRIGATEIIPSYADFVNAVNPSFRLPPLNGPDIYLHPNACPGPLAGQIGLPRPCAEAISADDPGTYVLNFRNEPIGLRIFEDANLNAILDPGEDLNGNGVLDQVIGDRGDLALAFQTRSDRTVPELNSQPAGPYPALTADLEPGDPWTPMMRVYMGDRVRIRVQVGAHEEEHNFTIHGLKWRKEANSPNSGYRNHEFFGIDEYFNLDIPWLPDFGQPGSPNRVDYLYTVGAETEGWWTGVWGLLRSYGKLRGDLQRLPNGLMTDTGLPIPNEADFDESCPLTAPLANNGMPFRVYAVRADTLFGPQGLTYNTRPTALTAPAGGIPGLGPLIDPTAIMYVLEEDLNITPGTNQTPPVINGLKPDVPVEPLILRARAGECIKVELFNALPSTMIDANGNPTTNQNQSIGFRAQADLPGYNALPPIIHKDENAAGAAGVPNGIVTFNANDMQPSSYVGLHPQLVAYNIRTSDGSNVGDNDFNPRRPGRATGSLIPPGIEQKGNNPSQFNSELMTWYAGDVRIDDDTGNLVATPVEFGATGLLSADKIKGSNKGTVGALIIEPADATWTLDTGTRAQATVTHGGGSFREFVTIMQNDLSLRYGGGACAADPTPFACAVPNIAAEGPLGPPEDPQDSGQMGINYRNEALWFRLGITPDTAFGVVDDIDTQDVFANVRVGGDPETPVFATSAGNEVRMRVVMPGGHARGTTYTVHGHEWQREPYTNDSTQIGNNPDSRYFGTQEGVNPAGHWDFVLENAGGPFSVTGDYLWRDQASFGSYQGLWGLMRVQ